MYERGRRGRETERESVKSGWHEMMGDWQVGKGKKNGGEECERIHKHIQK